MLINEPVAEGASSRYGEKLILEKAMASTCVEVVNDIEVIGKCLYGSSDLRALVGADIFNVEEAVTA
jgi:hypothetical protein